MNLRKFFYGLIVALMITVTANAAPEESANMKLAKIEIDTYGSEQVGALLDRVSRLEKDYSGRNMIGNMNARIEAIYDIIYNNATGPGVLAKINALEWNVNHEVSRGGIGNRLVALENQIIGTTSPASFNDRILALAKASYGEEILPIAQVQIPAGTLVKVETTAPVTSKTLQEGDTIPIRVVEDVFVNGSLVFVKGLPGEGTVTKVVRAKHIFNNGKIETDFNTLKAIDGQDTAICVGIEAQEAMAINGMASGLSLVGHTFSGKNQDLEKVIVRGKNVDLPAGAVLYVQIKTPILVYGVRENGVDGLLVDELITTAPSPKTETTSEAGTTSATETKTPVETAKPAPVESTPPAPNNEPQPLYDDEEIIEIIDED